MPRSILRTVTVSGERVRPRPPGHRSEKEIGRDRHYLTPAEVERLVATAKKRGRHGQRDALAILLAYRHGLRVSELVALRWSQFEWTTHRLTVHRLKGSISGVAHPVLPDETRALKALQREQQPGSQFVLMGERGPVSVAWFQRMLQRVGEAAGLPLVHPHQLRHATGFALADRGRDLREIQLHLGHKAISNTTQYVELRPRRLGIYGDGNGNLEWFAWFFDQGMMSWDEEMRQVELCAEHIIQHSDKAGAGDRGTPSSVDLGGR